MEKIYSICFKIVVIFCKKNSLICDISDKSKILNKNQNTASYVILSKT